MTDIRTPEHRDDCRDPQCPCEHYANAAAETTAAYQRHADRWQTILRASRWTLRNYRDTFARGPERYVISPPHGWTDADALADHLAARRQLAPTRGDSPYAVRYAQQHGRYMAPSLAGRWTEDDSL